MTRVQVIAEAGINHNGSLDMALQLVDVAAAAGADVVKFQTALPNLVVTAVGEKAEYQKVATGQAESQLEMLARLHLPLEDFRVIARHCAERQIAFLSTAFDLVSLEFLHDLGLSVFKVPSGEITNLPYLRRIGGFGGTVMLSTGMATLDEIDAALEVMARAGTPRQRVTILHCSTAYPTPMGDVNLRAMLTLGETFGVAVGYSDHTVGIEVPIAAAALGATVVEKHFTLDRNLNGPDHKASLEPAELRAMVGAIRNIEQALGDGVKRLGAAEAANRAIARRSLVAACAIRAGEAFTAGNLVAKRPGTGLSPMRWDEVVGRTAPRDFAADELIEL